MKIIDIREQTKPIKSNIRNAYIDFSKMTLSLVAVVTDVIRDGKPVIGYGFNSNGRYGQGALMRERFPPGFSLLIIVAHTLCGSMLSRPASSKLAGSASRMRGRKRSRISAPWP